MKILFVAPRYHTNFIPIVDGLVEKGHEVRIAVNNMHPDDDSILVTKMQQSIITRCMINLWKRKGDSYVEKKMILWFMPKKHSVQKMITEYRPDVVVLRDRNLLSLAFNKICKKRKIGKILLYNQTAVYRKKTEMKSSIFKKAWISLFPPKRITVCRYNEYPVSCNYYRDSNATFVPFVLRTTRKVIKDKIYAPNGVVRILDSGKYRPYKNHLLLVEAAKLLVQKGQTNFHITIVGQAKNKDEKEYKELVNKRILEHGLSEFFSVLDAVPYEAMENLFNCHDVYVLASSHELANVSIIDAMSYGLATISTNENGTSDYISDGEDGLIFLSRDAVDLSNKINQYLNNFDLISRHGYSAKKAIEEMCSFENYYTTFLDVVGSL